jgi:hypothetical protein
MLLIDSTVLLVGLENNCRAIFVCAGDCGGAGRKEHEIVERKSEA